MAGSSVKVVIAIVAGCYVMAAYDVIIVIAAVNSIVALLAENDILAVLTVDNVVSAIMGILRVNGGEGERIV